MYFVLLRTGVYFHPLDYGVFKIEHERRVCVVVRVTLLVIAGPERQYPV